jgi:hypothetical protein
MQRSATGQVPVAWTNLDLAKAMEWAKTLPEGASKRAAMLGVAYEAARAEPLQALELGGAMPESAERNTLLNACGESMGCS